MTRFSAREVLTLIENGAISKPLQVAYQGEGKSVESCAFSSHQRRLIAITCLFFILIIGSTVSGAFFFEGKVNSAIAVGSLFGLFALLVLVGTVRTYVEYKSDGNFGYDYGLLLDSLLRDSGQLCQLTLEELRRIAKDRLVEQAIQIRLAEQVEAENPLDDHPVSWKEQRDKFAMMFKIVRRFELIDETKGWRPYFAAARQA